METINYEIHVKFFESTYKNGETVVKISDIEIKDKNFINLENLCQ